MRACVRMCVCVCGRESNPVVNDTHLRQKPDSSSPDAVAVRYECIRRWAGHAHTYTCAKRTALVYCFSRRCCRMHLRRWRAEANIGLCGICGYAFAGGTLGRAARAVTMVTARRTGDNGVNGCFSVYVCIYIYVGACVAKKDVGS